MRALLLDLDGVLYRGEEVIPRAVETVQWIVDRGIPHLFLTNTTSRPRDAVAEKLNRFGIETDANDILSPPVAAAGWLRNNASGPVALFVPEQTRTEFAEFSIVDLKNDVDGVGSVVIGDLGGRWTYELLNSAFRMLMANPEAKLIALGMTRFWRATDGLRLDVAPFCRALECATGKEAIVLGKPAKNFFNAAIERLGCEASDAVMIGDDIVGDIDGAQKAGMRGLLVRTGKFAPPDLEKGIKPDAVIDSIADLPDWWIGTE